MIEYADYSECSLRPFRDSEGVCARCGAKLPGRRTRWCSEACMAADQQEHLWSAARYRALKRDRQRCVTCGSAENLEVNHIKPRVGRGYNTGCWNHLDNLETLCRRCHVAVTTRQRAERRGWEQIAMAQS